MKYDYLVVGAGLFGSIFAFEANKLNKKVLVIDKRDHLGGNCYTEKYEDYHIHKYGPHVFHTSQKYIWDYINQFTEFNNFSARVKSFVNNKIYSMPINLQTMSQVWPDVITPKQAKLRLEKEIIPNDNPKNLEEHCLSMIGPTLYNLFIKEYTAKQWGKDPKELPASIIKRLPVRFDMNDRYYHDSHIYEGIPTEGYTKIFERMLENIDVELSADYFSDREYFDKLANKVIYSGPIDKFFDYSFGDLEYRSLLFTRTFHSDYDYQGTAVVNYPELKYEYTRIIQHRYFNFGKSKRDIITHEYPQEYTKGKEPYYPINNLKNNEIYQKYKIESYKLKNVIIGGRLGNYKYYDMDMSIGNALSTIKKEFAGK
jgi:UDP-galactopyranose mutase